jgi:predicted Zn-dependent protease
MGSTAQGTSKARKFLERMRLGVMSRFRVRLRMSLLAAAAGMTACATSPMGRDQLILFPDDQVAQMGVTAYQELKSSTPVTKDSEARQYVSCVANALTRALPEGSAVQPEQWEVTVFADDQINAFALPGGKIGVYQGLLSVAENQDQLATVVAHEIAHVLSRHSNERISTQYATSTGLELASVLAGQSTPAKQTLFGLLGVGAQVGVLLPFGRKQESEADLVGLELMARAGFDPRQSVNLWQNMNAESDSGPPEFLSTHPSGETRIRLLQQHMPNVLSLADQARAGGTRPDCG